MLSERSDDPQWLRAGCPQAGEDGHISWQGLVQAVTGPFPPTSLFQLFAGKIKNIRKAWSCERELLKLPRLVLMCSSWWRSFCILHRHTNCVWGVTWYWAADGCLRATYRAYQIQICWPRAGLGNLYFSNVHPSLGSPVVGVPHIILQLLLKQ